MKNENKYENKKARAFSGLKKRGGLGKGKSNEQAQQGI